MDHEPERMRARRETVEHPFGTIKSWMGYTHFQMKTLPLFAARDCGRCINLKKIVGKPLYFFEMATESGGNLHLGF